MVFCNVLNDSRIKEKLIIRGEYPEFRQKAGKVMTSLNFAQGGNLNLPPQSVPCI